MSKVMSSIKMLLRKTALDENSMLAKHMKKIICKALMILRRVDMLRAMMKVIKK